MHFKQVNEHLIVYINKPIEREQARKFLIDKKGTYDRATICMSGDKDTVATLVNTAIISIDT